MGLTSKTSKALIGAAGLIPRGIAASAVILAGDAAIEGCPV